MSNSQIITVYAAGKIQTAQPGQKAKDFGNPRDSDFVLRNGAPGATFVDGEYALKEGDMLTVARRGQAGI